MQAFIARLIGSRTLIVMGVLFIAGILRTKYPGVVPDEGTLTGLVNSFLDVLLSGPGVSVVGVLMRFLTTTQVFNKPA